MKKAIVLFAAIAVTAVSVNATNMVSKVPVSVMDVKATPPAAVLAAFTANYGAAPVRQWKLRSNGNWRAHFTLNGVAWEATFTPAGVLVKAEKA